MTLITHHRLCACVAAVLIGVTCSPPIRAENVYVPAGAEWRFFRGFEEPSALEGEWRRIDFDDSFWRLGLGPLGYGDPPYGTDLSRLLPPMRENYTALYLRTTFRLTDASRVVELHANVDYDDGFIIWVNGTEVARSNAGDPDSFPSFTDVASGSHESGTYENFQLLDPSGYLLDGTNVVCVHALNRDLRNTDFKIDLEIIDPFGPDLTPPTVTEVEPFADSVVRMLTEVRVTFNEEVHGVDATDLLVSGVPAASIDGSGAGPYTFGFPQPANTTMTFEWTDGHGIVDGSGHELVPFGWSYSLDPDARPPAVIIAEFAASGSTLIDADGEAEDWIEIANTESFPVRMFGWSVTDDRETPDKWLFPDVLLAPGERLVLFASGKDLKPKNGQELHTNFKLAPGGEYLGLYAPLSPLVVAFEYAPRYPEQRPKSSYGIDHTGQHGYIVEPTPGLPNGDTTVLPGFTGDPKFSFTRGFYDHDLELEIWTTTPNATIYYSLDGSVPTSETGNRYEKPIAVSGTPDDAVANVRAVALRDGLVPSNVVTHSYVFAEYVLAQPRSPEGFPPRRWNGANGSTEADYEMDRRVLRLERNRQASLNALNTLPALSLTLPVDDFFGSRGIYPNANRNGVQWERAASAELLFPDGQNGFQIDCGLRTQGGSSTQNWKSKKLSLRLLFKSIYGRTTLRYPLFEDSPVETFDTIVLDAHLVMTFIHPLHEQRRRSQYVRDQFVADLQNAIGQPAPHGRFMNLFVDGLYWGLYNVHERPDHSFSAQYFGGEKCEYDSIRHGPGLVVHGDGRKWNETRALLRRDLRDLDAYQAVANVVDVPNLIDYMLVNIFVGNDDWPSHNWYISRRRTEDGKWRFFSWDAEHVLKDVFKNQVNVNFDGSPTEPFQRLRRNPEFQLLVADHAHRYFFNGGPFFVNSELGEWDPQNPQNNVPASMYMARFEEIRDAIILESARWGDVQRRQQPYGMPEVQRELNWLLESYFPRRAEVVLSHLRRAQLYPQVAAPVFDWRGGDFAPGSLLRITVPDDTEGTIYYTTDGTDPRTAWSGEIADTALEYDGKVTLTGTVVHIKARTLADSEWSALNESIFTVPFDKDALRITEVMYNPPDGGAFEFLELTNVGDTAINIGEMIFVSGIEYAFPPKTVLAAGKSLVLVRDPVAFENRYPHVEIGGEFTGNLNNGGEGIALATKDGDTVVSIVYDDESGWPIGPDGFGFSLVPVDPTGHTDLSAPSSWRASTQTLGSPDEADPLPPHGDVLVNEILARSTAPLDDAIELHNPTNEFIDIGGWYLSDSRDSVEELKKFRIPDGTSIPAEGYVVFYESQFNVEPGTGSNFALRGNGEGVYLSAAVDGELTGFITGGRYDGADNGVSLGRVESAAGRDFLPLEAPTFSDGVGGSNVPVTVGPVVINEIHYNPRSMQAEFIELHNTAGSPVTLFETELGRGWTVTGVSGSNGDGSFEFGPETTIPPLGYLLVSAIPEASLRQLYLISPETPIVGPYGGALSKSGERVKLFRPLASGADDVALVDHVRYRSHAPWPTESHRLGRSLERVLAEEYGNDPVNWGASLVNGGTPGSRNTVSEPRGDESRLQLPGDINQDRTLNVTDVVTMLRLLFPREPNRTPLPCGDRTLQDEANRLLLDADGSTMIDLGDAVTIVNYLFLAGAPHVLGTACMEIRGCPGACD